MTLGLPIVGADVKVWANDLRRTLGRQWDRLSWRTTGQTASDDGIILWDAQSGYPVVSLDGEWQEIVLAKSASAAVAQAERVVLSTYGDTVSVKAKAKNLNKFGTNTTVGTTFETVAQFQGTVANETFVATNIIDSVVSSSTSDTTQTVSIEGHTIDGSGNLTFTVQDAALNGRTEVTLATPLARCTRIRVKRSGVFGTTPTALDGNVSVYDNTDGITNGVPNTDAAVKARLVAGATSTQKCATSVSATDYWFITTFTAGVGNSGGSANRVTFKVETRDVANGGPWLPSGREIVATVGQDAVPLDLDPYIIVPKNHDVRVVAKTNSNTAEVFAELRGVLASVQ